MKNAHHLDTVAATLRQVNSLKLLSPLNEKTPKGEALGYLTAILYLAPHTLGGKKSVCPHSTPVCRAGCLFTAGRGNTPRVYNARLRRTRMYHETPELFLAALVDDLETMQAVADAHDMTMAIRLNGTSDILFEREMLDGKDLFGRFPRAIFYDYTRTPFEHRHVPENWRLTFSLADAPLAYAINHLTAGRNVAAVVPELEKAQAPDWFMLGDTVVNVIDGEAHDLRFLDPPSSLVLLKPKGRLRSTSEGMVRSALIGNLYRMGKDRKESA